MTAETVSLSSSERSWVLAGVPHSAEALAIAELLQGRLQKAQKDILHIAVSDRDLDMMAQALAFFAPEVEVLRFPAWDSMPYDRASPQVALMAARMLVLSRLAKGAGGKPRVVLTTANAALQKLPPRSVIAQAVLELQVGQTISQDALIRALVAQGYHRNGKAMEPGEFALRGGIVDLVPPGMSEGIRVDFFGDEIETLRRYDPLTQVTQGKMERLALYPVSEVLLGEESVERFRQAYRELFGAVVKDDPLYESISQQRAYPGMEHWLPLFYERVETLFDYCAEALVTFDAEAQTAIAERHESILDYYDARKEALAASSKKNSFGGGAIYNPLPPERGFLMEDAWQVEMGERGGVQFSPFAQAGAGSAVEAGWKPVIRFTQGPGAPSPFEQLKDRGIAVGKSMLLACFSQGSRERLQTLLMEHGFHCVKIEQWGEMKDVRGKAVGLAVLPLESGFETDKALVLSEQDVLGERIVRVSAKKKKSEVFLLEAANFAEGELVVHKEHGIGRFEGLITLTVSGAAHDCLKLIYEGDDKLFLPVENIEMVSRFGLEEENVKLDKLGGASWQSRKAKLKQRILMAAEELLKIAAERLVAPGRVVEAPVGTYDDFCSRFAYVETEDQARAIDEVVADLHSGKPMDRLVCGDVGFGKTEVALRAAFIATSSPNRGEGGRGAWDNENSRTPRPHPRDADERCAPPNGEGRMQVAVIVPTTLLARQHYKNFAARFEGFGVVVRQLSRMVTTREQKETREGLAEGKVDIVIGTHALLSKQVAFKNLGLVIVDEEQHFGVAQKEKLKALKADVHVLTLSATPIPRTLQMALTGVRDLSLITTPPVDRLAVRSFVMPFDPVVLKEALARELHRGGQCFVVTPRIKDMAEVKLQLQELMPEVRLAVAHGQMAAADLDSIMNDFYDGKYDVLLSTAIIESGLDIPNANTMIIHNAHLLGLAQLYQLRGRVGRGKLRAYSYFLLPHHRQLSKNATRRLEVMQTLDTLGAGFTLASHDMDIRGFGNLVGEEQSGHIREVGIELYQQMLEEAVESLKRNTAAQKDPSAALRSAQDDNRDWSPQINLGISVLIPETYVDDLQLRLGLYRRAAGLAGEEDINSFAAELTDRFGDMPEEVQHLISTLGIKALCKKAGIERIDVGPKGAVMSFKDNLFAKPEALMAHVAKNVRYLKIRPDQKLVFAYEWKGTEDKIAMVRKWAGEMAGLAA